VKNIRIRFAEQLEDLHVKSLCSPVTMSVVWY